MDFSIKDNLLTKEKMTVPECPLFGDSTVHKCARAQDRIAQYPSLIRSERSDSIPRSVCLACLLEDVRPVDCSKRKWQRVKCL